MEVRVLFFARSRELAGTNEATLTLPDGSTTLALLEQLMTQYPALVEIRGAFVLALNQEYLDPEEEARLKAGDEVAIIPPISGG